MMVAISCPCQVTLVVCWHEKGDEVCTSNTYVTGSLNSMRASNGPMLVNAPCSSKSNPPSERFLIN